MKRLNPMTLKPYKNGDIREDGFIFRMYRCSEFDATGFFVEYWLSPEKHAEATQKAKQFKADRMLQPNFRAAKLVRDAKRRAFKSSLEFGIQTEDISYALDAGVCQLTGIQFDFAPPTKGKHNPYAPSIDRIDCNKGYTKSNVRIVLLAVNLALNQYGQNAMLPILEAMVEAIKNAKPQ